MYLPFAVLCAVVLPSDLTTDEFRSLHQKLEPAADEPWKTIPWKISLIEAQQEASESKKPLFIWAMDGHPMGCT